MFWKFLPVKVIFSPATASPGVTDAIAGVVAALIVNASLISTVVPFFKFNLKPLPAQAVGTVTAIIVAV